MSVVRRVHATCRPRRRFSAPPKLTGKTRNGWSLGLLNAVTDRETARTESEAIRGCRDGGAAHQLPRDAHAARHRPPRRRRLPRDRRARGGSTRRRCSTASLRAPTWWAATATGSSTPIANGCVTGKMAGSWIHGTTTMMTRAQRAAQRYFQRPDAPHVTLDPARTSLDGFTGRINLNRNSGLLHVNAAFWGVSPGFESNDLGFHGDGRSLRRPRRGDVARRHARPHRPRVERLGRQVVDVQFQSRAAGRRREQQQLGAVPQLLERERRRRHFSRGP